MKRNTTKLILSAIALGMGVSTLVLNILGSMTVSNGITLLSIGVISLAILNLQDK